MNIYKPMIGRTNGRNRRGGSVLVEFAACVIVLLFLLIGLIEFGWLIKNNLVVQNATREGARVASIGRSTTEIKARINNSVRTAGVTDVVISLKHAATTTDTFAAFPVDVTTKTPAQNGVPAGNMIEVVVTAKNKRLTGFSLIPIGRDIASRVVMIREASQ